MNKSGNQKIKIAHVVLSLDIGGLEMLVVDMIKNLDWERFEVVVVCLREKGVLAREIESLGFKVYSLGNRDKLEFGSFFKLAKLLVKENVDIVHCHNTAGYLYGGIAAILAGFKKIIYTEHGRVFPDSPRRMLAERILSWFTYKIVAVSEDMKRCLVKYEKINPDKIQVIHNGIDRDKFHSLGLDARCEMRNALGIAHDDIVIGNVARLDPVKDHCLLLRAMALLLAKDKGLRIKDQEKPLSIIHHSSSLKLLLVGDGPERENIERLISNLKLEASCILLGARTDIPELMNIMDVFALSSKNEGISLTLLEAMACGVPVVATRVGGNPEIVKDGENGLLCESGNPQDLVDKILKILNSPFTCHSSSVTLKSMINQYEMLYASE